MRTPPVGRPFRATAAAAPDPLEPALPEQTRPTMPHGAAAAARTRAMLSQPGRVATMLWAAGVLAVASVIPLRHWSQPALTALLIVAGIAAIFGGVRAVVGSRRRTRWGLQVNVGIANLLVSVATAAGNSENIHLANLYVLVALYAVLYLSPRAAVAHIGVAGAAYAMVLALGPASDDPPVIAWVSVLGTVAVLAPIVLGLMVILRSAAMQDPLTGLANRRSWDERLAEELQRCRRTGAALSVAMIDLDGFKAVNDRDGHEAGDHLLRDLAHAWQGVVRGGGDFLARVGGDEFALLAPGSDATGIRLLAERLGDVSPEGVSWSIGMATWDGTEHAQDMLRRADLAMYETKQCRRREQPATG